MDSNMASNLVIYTTVCVFLNGSADLAREEDPPLICVFVLGKSFTKQARVQVGSDRILMDASDAMENIKGLI